MLSTRSRLEAGRVACGQAGPAMASHEYPDEKKAQCIVRFFWKTHKSNLSVLRCQGARERARLRITCVERTPPLRLCPRSLVPLGRSSTTGGSASGGTSRTRRAERTLNGQTRSGSSGRCHLECQGCRTSAIRFRVVFRIADGKSCKDVSGNAFR